MIRMISVVALALAAGAAAAPDEKYTIQVTVSGMS
jgi:hypothetical protein